MAPLGVRFQTWVSAEASLPLDWQIVGLWRSGEVWISLAEGPDFDDYASGVGRWEYLALHRLSDRLRERLGPTTG